MASYTPNHNLYKPSGSDPYGDFITKFGDNMDIIDNLGGGGGSGHTIINPSGSDMPQETGLQFTGNVTVNDDSVNDKTVIDIGYGFPPLIYSDSERLVGVWRDNKPLYQKTVHITALPSAVGTPTGYVHNIADIDLICDFEGTIHFANGNASKFDRLAMLTNGTAGIDAVSSMVVYVSKTSIDITVGANRSTASADFTIRYTKTTDTAGSGNWNTNGVPTVHYSTNEEVIGTYLGKPLYQVMRPITQALNISANTWVKTEYAQTDEESLVTIKMTNNVGAVIEALSGGFVDSKIAINSPRAFNMGANTGYYILQYTKTTD